MTSQFDFTNDQWTHVATTPVLVGMAVAEAGDSGFFGSLKELRTLADMASAPTGGNPAAGLIEQAANTDVSDRLEGFKQAGADALADSAVNACRDLAGMLASVAESDEADGYKRWVLEVATSVADAAKEDGVRRIDGEAEVLRRIEQALA